jgi:hypothetical protein
VAGGKILTPDETAGVGAVDEIEGMDVAAVNEVDGSAGVAVSGAGSDDDGSFDDVKGAADFLEGQDAESPWAAIVEYLQQSPKDGSGHG